MNRRRRTSGTDWQPRLPEMPGTLSVAIPSTHGDEPPSLERIERVMLAAAELVDHFGPVVQPILDRLEADYAAARARGTAAERIRNLIGAN